MRFELVTAQAGAKNPSELSGSCKEMVDKLSVDDVETLASRLGEMATHRDCSSVGCFTGNKTYDRKRCRAFLNGKGSSCQCQNFHHALRGSTWNFSNECRTRRRRPRPDFSKSCKGMACIVYDTRMRTITIRFGTHSEIVKELTGHFNAEHVEQVARTCETCIPDDMVKAESFWPQSDEEKARNQWQQGREGQRGRKH